MKVLVVFVDSIGFLIPPRLCCKMWYVTVNARHRMALRLMSLGSLVVSFLGVHVLFSQRRVSFLIFSEKFRRRRVA